MATELDRAAAAWMVSTPLPVYGCFEGAPFPRNMSRIGNWRATRSLLLANNSLHDLAGFFKAQVLLIW